MQKTIKKLYNWIPFKRPVIEFIKKHTNPSRKIYHFLRFDGLFEVRVNKNTSFKMYNYTTQLENDIFWKGLENGWEKHSIGLWKELAKHADVIFDVGANTGVYSLVAKALNPKSRVYAFEPVERVYEKLVFNNQINDFDIVCSRLALSNYDGTATIYDQDIDHIYSVTVNKDMTKSHEKAIPVSIKTSRFDTYAAAHHINMVSLMKIDVETHEPEVLEGMGDFLSKHSPDMLIEILDDEVGQRIQSIISDIPYTIYQIDEDKGLSETNTIVSTDSWNYFLCSPKTKERQFFQDLLTE